MNKYDKAVATWIGKRVGRDPETITEVEFATIYGGYCETCGYETFGFTYKLKNGQWQDIEIGDYSVTPGQFMEECIAFLENENEN